MYLKSIKLAGFKSFVDPTTIPIRGHMSAVVGPNGCGKSNVVDAIRWVIGELSAKHLRGQNMNDVIFNGTTSRKPVGKASIELHFDNNAGRITGEFARYSEIVVRREVERDAQSSYFVNGTHVRRKDVIDIFLGTGLGPRSYAIIEQGMISKLIEAKPEDLRVYIEEAAGISKYRERRRETENRMRHTQENLDRMNDICEELEKQLRHLKRQANAAERYKEFKQEERLLSAQMKALQWQGFEKKIAEQEEQIKQHDLQREAQRANQRDVETQIEKARVDQEEATEQHNEVQKRYYGLGADIARLEQRIKSTQEQTEQWQKELEDSELVWQELTDNSLECQEQVSELEEELGQLDPQRANIQSTAVQAQQALEKAESDRQQCQVDWDTFQENASRANSQIEVSRTKVEHGQRQLNDLNNRRHQTEHELNQLQLDVLRDEIVPLASRADALNQQLEQVNAQLQNYADQISRQRAMNHETSERLQAMRRETQAVEARQASLDALQKSALGHDDEQTNRWLSAHELTQHPRLGEKLQVSVGWELAVETILSGYFDAICVDDLNDYVEQMGELSQGRLTLLEKSAHPPLTPANKGPTLASQVNSDWPFHHWLSGIYIADDLEAARTLRTQLNSEESVITREGIWMGHSWLRVCKKSDAQSGVLVREQQLKQLQEQLDSQSEQLEQQTAQLDEGESQLNRLETERDAMHQEYQGLSSQRTSVQADLSAKKTRLDGMQQRETRLQKALHEFQLQIESTEREWGTVKENLTNLLEDRENQVKRRDQLVSQRHELQDVLEQQRGDAQRKQQAADELGIRLSANQSQLAVLRQTVQRDGRQLEQLSERREVLTSQLGESGTPLESMKAELQTLLDRRLSIETELRAVEAEVLKYNELLKELASRRDHLQETLTEFQSQLESLRMERQTLSVRQATIKEQLDELDLALDTVMAELPEEAQMDAWEAQLAKVSQRIQRLGPINLAAIEEYETTSERKEYLDKQHADLTEALTILQEAIHKIDRETRSKFRDTFDHVAQKFQEIFPKIFGGGRAYLELTDNDLLSTGIIVRAQPPGKRNVTIHMLSGGEKALTAISLVFALFQLNPAPFCILDEVDAPLDDVNVGRFCQLVKAMSQETQFLVISHNKVTIEMADHLMGVTMQEPGVSRIVSVDMEEAMGMVEAA